MGVLVMGLADALCLLWMVHGSGYIQSCKEIVGAAMKIQAAITHEIPELYVLGKPLASVVAFGSKSLAVNVMEVGDVMSTKGWHLNALSNPPAVHIACTVSRHFVSRCCAFL
jgi:sphinganine-1-phosphate aldolase